MAPYRLSTLFKDIDVNDIFIVVNPINLEGSSLGNGRVIAQDNPVLANVDIVKAHFLPNRNVGVRSVGVLEDAPAVRVVLAHGDSAVAVAMAAA